MTMISNPKLFSCQKCTYNMPESAFYKRKNGSIVLSGCKKCRRNASHVWRETHPEAKREWSLKSLYGIKIKEFNRQQAEQNNCCYICGRFFSKVRPTVDHNHETGFFRGLLCDLCNRGIGCFHDNPTALRRAADYLEETTHGYNLDNLD